MKLFAIADLHLPGGDDKPMDVFGPQWDGHFERISRDWRQRVGPEDLVLIPGDISWAMQLDHALPDLRAIGALPGRKLLIKGNHDYWWSSLTRVQEALPAGMKALQHSAVDAGDWVVCGTRGWMFPSGETPLSPEDDRVYRRELLRLEMALAEAERTAAGRPVIVMLHYPPLYDTQRDTAFTEMLTAHGAHTVVYGHLHGAGIRAGYSGMHRGVRYALTSCDSLDFTLLELPMDA